MGRRVQEAAPRHENPDHTQLGGSDSRGFRTKDHPDQYLGRRDLWSDGDEELSESTPPGSDFLSHLARDWEAEAYKAVDKGVRVLTTRFGIILGKGGGALTQMTLPFKFFAGGPIGSGRQWVPWMHVKDLCRAELFLIENENIRGPVNFSAPVPVTECGPRQGDWKGTGKTVVHVCAGLYDQARVR
jgi:hypothetical protein